MASVLAAARPNGFGAGRRIEPEVGDYVLVATVPHTGEMEVARVEHATNGNTSGDAKIQITWCPTLLNPAENGCDERDNDLCAALSCQWGEEARRHGASLLLRSSLYDVVCMRDIVSLVTVGHVGGAVAAAGESIPFLVAGHIDTYGETRTLSKVEISEILSQRRRRQRTNRVIEARRNARARHRASSASSSSPSPPSASRKRARASIAPSAAHKRRKTLLFNQYGMPGARGGVPGAATGATAATAAARTASKRPRTLADARTEQGIRKRQKRLDASHGGARSPLSQLSRSSTNARSGHRATPPSHPRPRPPMKAGGPHAGRWGAQAARRRQLRQALSTSPTSKDAHTRPRSRVSRMRPKSRR